jgi:hypothetical protein
MIKASKERYADLLAVEKQPEIVAVEMRCVKQGCPRLAHWQRRALSSS